MPVDEDHCSPGYGRRSVGGASHFDAYREISALVDRQFGWLDASFPLIRRLLEKELRHYAAGEVCKADHNLLLLTRFSSVKRSLRAVFDTGAFARSNQRRTVLLQLSRFPALAELIADVGRDQHWRTGTADTLFFRQPSLKGSFVPLPLRPAILSSCRFKRTIRDVRRIGLSQIEAYPALLEKLEQICRDEVVWISRQLSSCRVGRIVLMEDSSSIAQLLCIAAQTIGVPATVIAHGYIQDPKLISICPINADKLLVWTEEQEKALTAVLSPEQASRVEFVGFPKLQPNPRAGLPNRLLYAAEPLFSTDRPPLPWPRLCQLFWALSKNGFDVILRLHPKDLIHGDLLKEAGLTGCVTLSKVSLHEELMLAGIVLGSNSSVLVEAAFAGRRAVQIEEGRRVHLERVEVMSLANCADLCPSAQQCRSDDALIESETARVAFTSYFDAWLREA